MIFSVNSNFAGSFPFTGFTLKWYRELVGDPWIMNSVKNSLQIAIISSILAVSVAAPAAYTVARFNFPGKSILKLSIVIPMTIPAIMLGFALLSLFNAADVTLSILTVIIGHVTFVLPYVFFVISAQQYGFDKSLEDAGMDLGANRWATFRRITLPLMVPGLMAGGLFAFTLSMDEFIITFLVTGVTQTLPLFVWGMLRTMVAPTVNAVGSLIVVFAFIIIFGLQYKNLRRKRL